MIKRKYSVTILDENWNQLRSDLDLLIVPREGELIYLPHLTKYFSVIKVIHYLNDKQGIFIVVAEYFDRKTLDRENILKISAE